MQDYIGKPKKNGYQSLHMLVQPAGGEGTPPVELQIRTERMDAQAVSGAAAHGAYKGGLTDPQQVRRASRQWMQCALPSLVQQVQPRMVVWLVKCAPLPGARLTRAHGGRVCRWSSCASSWRRLQRWPPPASATRRGGPRR